MSERVKRWTKGTWRTGHQGGLSGDVISWQCFLDDVDCKQLPISCQGKAVAVINYSQNSETHKADAALIAAAPALVEALEAFVNYNAGAAAMYLWATMRSYGKELRPHYHWPTAKPNKTRA